MAREDRRLGRQEHQMTETQKQSVYSIITERVLGQLAAGVVPWRKPWVGDMPKNLLTGREYRGINSFLLHCAPFNSSYWMTYRQAAELGGCVRGGSKGQPVVFWRWTDKVERDGAGVAKLRRSAILRHYTVFNAEQVDGVQPPPEEPVAKFSPIDRCDAVVAGMPNKPTIEHNEARAYYQPSTDLVNMPRPTRFASSEGYYTTLFHELTHATGHASRIGREGIEQAHYFGDAVYSREELIAEMGAAFLAGHCGIEETLSNSASYIDGWRRKLDADPRLVVTAAGAAQKAADYILGRRFSDEAVE